MSIGLIQKHDNKYEVSSYETKFKGRSLTLGEGIKREFPKIDVKLTHPFDKYVERFLEPELKSVFQFPPDDKFTENFIRNVNSVSCLLIHAQSLGQHFQVSGKSFTSPHNKEISSQFQSLVKDVDKIKVTGHEEFNFSNGDKVDLAIQVHDVVIEFIELLLEKTKQVSFQKIGIAEKIHSEQLTKDYGPWGLFSIWTICVKFYYEILGFVGLFVMLPYLLYKFALMINSVADVSQIMLFLLSLLAFSAYRLSKQAEESKPIKAIQNN